jgi:CubicO group peptidase (beta-lactamase class C family)
MRRFWFAFAWLLAAASASASAGTIAPVPHRISDRTASEARPFSSAASLTAEDVSAWLDGFMPIALAKGDIAGAQVVVVRGDEVVALKGYGYVDVQRRIPVDPDKHLFRPGSIAKLFTWVAVMQLVEQGKIDLDRDINSYLDFQLPSRSGGPITMRHLMTHTPGFEDSIRALITPDSANVGLERALKNWTPRRVYAAGTTPAYSNYGTGLAGYIVERVSGMPFDDYVETRIFRPIGMNSSSFRQPLPRQLEVRMSRGYITASGDPLPFEFVSLPPVGALATPASDMAKFLAAMLGSQQRGSAILRAETLRAMHGTRASSFPQLNTMLLGFYENDLNGRKIVAHSGDTTQFHSELNLFIEDGVAIYVSFNSLGADGASVDFRTALVRGFANRYFPSGDGSGPAAPEARVSALHAELVAGRYDNSRRSITSFLAGLSLLAQARIVDNGDGTISFPAMTDIAGMPKKWKEVAPFLWQEVGGPERLAAAVVDGKVVRIGHSAYPYMVWDRAPWWRDTGWLLPLTKLALAVLMLAIFLWPVGAMVRRRFGVRLDLSSRARFLRLGVRLCAVALTGAVLLWAMLLQTLLNNLSPGGLFNAQVIIATALTLGASLAGLVMAAYSVVILRRDAPDWMSTIGNAVLAIAFATFLWVGFAFNLFAFSTQF